MNARMPVVASIAFAALIHPLTVGAQPVVSSVSQQTSGSTPVLVVSGSQFGTHGNFNPSGTGGFLNAAWRDFEDGQFNGGNMFLDDKGSPSQWSLPTSGNRPNSLRYIRKVYVNSRLGDFRYMAALSPNKWFVSFWFMEDVNSRQQSGKFWRQYYSTTDIEPNIYLVSGGVNGMSLRGFAECRACSPSPTTVWGSPDSFVGNQWHRVDIEIAQSPDWFAVYMDGVLQWRRSSTLSGSEDQQWLPGSISPTDQPMQFGSMLDDSSTENWPANGFYAFDDIYVDYTYARVELGNASTWAACTRREIQLPRQWAASSITVQLNKGAFNNGQVAYLYVVDSSGKVNANGFPVTIGNTAPDTTPPTVTSVSPAGGSTNVAGSASLTVLFSEAVDPATVSTSTIELRNPSNVVVASTVTYDGATRTATLRPNATLSSSTTYTATVKGGTSGVKDLAGNPLGANFTWSFTTGVVDVTAPSVSITSPAASATVTGTVTVSASASDNIGVAGVQFMLDGIALGAEDVASPHSISWNTLGATNGSRVLTAVARDAAGNRTTSAAVTVTVANSAASSLIAAYGFEEGSGATVIDLSGNSNTGTISGATRTTSGRFGSALSFNGVNNWVTVADAASLDLSTGMTLEAWVNPTALSGWRTVVFKETSAGLAYVLYANDNDPKPATYVRRTGASLSDGASGTVQLPLNTWTHLAATFDGVNLRLFVGGVRVDSQPVSGSITQSVNPLHIGGNAIWGEYFAGSIDEVRIYNRALTAAEIATDMSTPVRTPTKPAPPTNLRVVR